VEVAEDGLEELGEGPDQVGDAQKAN
jgi:hypothetical protein